jgi:phage shock protein A
MIAARLKLKTTLRRLDQKLKQRKRRPICYCGTPACPDVIQSKRAKDASGSGSSGAFDRMKHRVAHQQATSQAKSEIGADNVEDRLAEHGRRWYRAIAGGNEDKTGSCAFHLDFTPSV